jgi:hypothetical protein
VVVLVPVAARLPATVRPTKTTQSGLRGASSADALRQPGAQDTARLEVHVGGRADSGSMPASIQSVERRMRREDDGSLVTYADLNAASQPRRETSLSSTVAGTPTSTVEALT